MWKYLLKRFLLMFPTLVGVAVVTFLLIRVIPGDVVELRLAGDRGAASQAAIDAERVRFGLDQPVWKQFATWIAGVARLDFGTSMWTGSPIWDEIKLRFALSLQVAIMATLVAVTLAVAVVRRRLRGHDEDQLAAVSGLVLCRGRARRNGDREG